MRDSEMSETIDAKALAVICRVSEDTIIRWHKAGEKLPAPIPSPRDRGVRWLVADIDAWEAAGFPSGWKRAET